MQGTLFFLRKKQQKLCISKLIAFRISNVCKTFLNAVKKCCLQSYANVKSLFFPFKFRSTLFVKGFTQSQRGLKVFFLEFLSDQLIWQMSASNAGVFWSAKTFFIKRPLEVMENVGRKLQLDANSTVPESPLFRQTAETIVRARKWRFLWLSRGTYMWVAVWRRTKL